MRTSKTWLAVLVLSTLCLWTPAHGQITPAGDAYTNTADPNTNYGAAVTLNVNSTTQIAYIQFNLSSIPASYTGANVSQATLKLYVYALASAGSLNVDYVSAPWSESTITPDNAPALGSTIASGVPVSEKNQYILINVTAAVQAWLNGTELNNGIALVGVSPLTASFDSKENAATSHPAELDIVFLNGGAQGPAGPQGVQGPPGPQGPEGPIGSTGATGPQGPAGITNLGTWNSTTAYQIGNSVSYAGSSWIALAANTNSTPSATNSNWQLLAAPGINNQGSWVSTTNYQIGDAVSDGGQFWLAVAPNIASEPSILNPSWQLIAASGTPGATGATGPSGQAGQSTTGPQGPQGPAGTQGPQGPTGATGYPGPAGPTGATGPQGPAGPAGPAGSAGVIGSLNSLNGIPCTISLTTGVVALTFTGNGVVALNCNLPPPQNDGVLVCGGNELVQNVTLAAGTEVWYIVTVTGIPTSCAYAQVQLITSSPLLFDVRSNFTTVIITEGATGNEVQLTSFGTYYIRVFGSTPSASGTGTLTVSEN